MTTPDTIDRYKVQEELGRGGMATVFKAHDPLFERIVAIKVLPPSLSHDQQFRARFIREARTIAALEHPAIVPVYDYGEAYSQPYLVMRHMPGGSLTDRLRKGPLSLEETGTILQRIGSALDAAHGKGIIHRDLKPGNILFDQYGEAYLADFGIVHVAASDEALTATGSLIGTPSYMSPEQVHGDKVIDGRSDIYALGVILFQMLTGDVPYAADTPVKTMMQHVMEPIPRILDARPDLAPQFDTVISKAMAKERDDRFATGGELAGELKHLIDRSISPPSGPAIPSGVRTELLSESEIAQPPPEPVRMKPVDVPPITPAPSGTPMKAAPVHPVKSKPDGGGRRLSPAFWVGIGLLVVICLGVVGAGIWVANNYFALPDRNVVIDDSPSVVTVEVATVEAATVETNDAVDLTGTETAAALVSTREQLAIDATTTANAESAEPPTATADTARENALATRQALATAAASESPDVDRPESSSAPIHGPTDGALQHDEDDLIESVFADVSPADFIMQTTFFNPYAVSVNPWDFGVTFRQAGGNDELRLILQSDGFWNLNDRRGSENNIIHEGDLTGLLNTQDAGSNTLLLAALGDRGYFFLNGRFAAALDLSSRTEAGDLALGTGFYASTEQAGEVTEYADFAVLPGDPLFGPDSGGLEHIADEFIKTHEASVFAYNFIATAEMGNPYATSAGPWDIGIGFRDEGVGEQFWFIIESSGAWSFINRQANDDTFLDDGTLSNLDTNEKGSNRLVLVALDDIGYFFLNDELVTSLDLSSRSNAGDISVVTAFFTGDEIEGNTTTFADFTIWPLP